MNSRNASLNEIKYDLFINEYEHYLSQSRMSHTAENGN